MAKQTSSPFPTLTKKTLVALRKEIVLCSVFVGDYENSLGFDPNKVCDFFDGYADYLGELMCEDGITDAGFFANLRKYDNPQNLWAWRLCYEGNPLA